MDGSRTGPYLFPNVHSVLANTHPGLGKWPVWVIEEGPSSFSRRARRLEGDAPYGSIGFGRYKCEARRGPVIRGLPARSSANNRRHSKRSSHESQKTWTVRARGGKKFVFRQKAVHPNPRQGRGAISSTLPSSVVEADGLWRFVLSFCSLEDLISSARHLDLKHNKLISLPSFWFKKTLRTVHGIEDATRVFDLFQIYPGFSNTTRMTDGNMLLYLTSKKCNRNDEHEIFKALSLLTHVRNPCLPFISLCYTYGFGGLCHRYLSQYQENGLKSYPLPKLSDGTVDSYLFAQHVMHATLNLIRIDDHVGNVNRQYLEDLVEVFEKCGAITRRLLKDNDEANEVLYPITTQQYLHQRFMDSTLSPSQFLVVDMLSRASESWQLDLLEKAVVAFASGFHMK